MSLALRRYVRSFLIVIAVVSTACFLPSVSSAYPARLAYPSHLANPLHPNAGSAPQLEVVGNQLVDKNTGSPIVLHGMDRNGTQDACINPSLTWDHKYHVFPDKNGPTTVEIAAMKNSWGVNAVSIPLNEDCWLNKNMPTGGIGGSAYINAIKAYVNLLNQAGIVAILDLHYTAPGNIRAYSQESMPDASWSLSFWASAATLFAGNDAVVFDAFSEPVPPKDHSNGYDTKTWYCWLMGQTYSGDPNSTCGGGCPDFYDGQNGTTRVFDCVGMQAVVQTIRTATSPAPDNVIMLGGANYSKEFNLWNLYLPTDPNTGQTYTNLAVNAHLYSYFYYDQSSLTQQMTNGYPVVAGEIGGGGVSPSGYTKDTFLLATMGYLDNPSGNNQTIPAQSYLAWHWNADNVDHMAMISDFTTFNPSNCYGQAYQAHLTGGTLPNC